jgi:predicted negative regulator of RcsB-dependent stress response
MMSKLIDYADFLIIALLIALGIYVGWTAFESRPLVQPKAAAFEVAIANAAPTTIERLTVTPRFGVRRQPAVRSG